MQENVLQKAKMKRMKEIKSSEVMTDVLFYSLFLVLLLIVAYGHRDPRPDKPSPDETPSHNGPDPDHTKPCHSKSSHSMPYSIST